MSLIRIDRSFCLLGLAFISLCLPGCGGCGGTTQADLLRAARRSSGDENEDEETASSSNPATTQGSNNAKANAANSSDPNNNASQATGTTSNQSTGPAVTQTSPGNRGQAASGAGMNPVVSNSNKSSASTDDVSTSSPSGNSTNNAAANVVAATSAGSQTFQPAKSIKERRERSIANMSQIVKAMLLHLEKKNTLPPLARYDLQGNPLLSWRVELLPLLGYQSLYDQFRLDEPWNSEHNLKLIELMPDCYRDPVSGNTKTPYLVPVATSSAFPPNRRLITERQIEDGLANLVVLLEVNDSEATIWTQPEDLAINPLDPRDNLGTRYEDGFFSAWGNAEVRVIKPTASREELFGMITIDGGESVSRVAISLPANGEPAFSRPGPEAVADAANNAATTAPTETPANEPATEEQVGEHASSGMFRSPVTEADKMLQVAINSLTEENEVLAFQQKYAELILRDPKQVVSQWSWVNGLERPAISIRWGIGMEVVGNQKVVKNVAPIADRDNLQKWKRDLTGEREFETYTGELGIGWLELLRTRQDEGKFGIFATLGVSAEDDVKTRVRPVLQARPRNEALEQRHHYPNIHLLGFGNRNTLVRLAEESGCDICVILRVEGKQLRTGDVHNSTEASVIDAMTGQELFGTPALNNIRVARDRANRISDDPVVEWLKDINTRIEEGYTLSPLPALTPDDARARLKELKEGSYESPLKPIAEAALYLGLGVISEYEYREACVAIAGSDEAEILVDGADRDRRLLLEKWISDRHDDQLGF